VMSAVYKSDAYKNRAIKDLEADAFLTKPFELCELMTLIDKYLGTTLSSDEKKASSTTTTDSEALRGELSPDLPFAALLYSLYQQRLTGIVFLSTQHISKTIYLSDGVPVFVDSNLKDETLGDLLLKKRKILQEDYDTSVKLMKEDLFSDYY